MGVKLKVSKAINKYTSLIIVLSVLLAISLVAGATFAWFASSDRSVTTISLGDPVVVNITESDDGKILPDGADLPFTIDSPRLLPGMRINTYAGVKFQASKTPALLRVKLNVTVEGGSANQQETAELVGLLNEQIMAKAAFNGESHPWILDSDTGWWYYTNGNNDTQDIKNSTVEHIVCEAGPVIDFLNPNKDQVIIMPTIVDNKFSTAKVTFWFSVQAIQALIPSSPEDNTGTYMVTTIRNVESIFAEAFAGSDSNI